MGYTAMGIWNLPLVSLVDLIVRLSPALAIQKQVQFAARVAFPRSDQRLAYRLRSRRASRPSLRRNASRSRDRMFLRHGIVTDDRRRATALRSALLKNEEIHDQPQRIPWDRRRRGAGGSDRRSGRR